jgi:CheY-like chemotaxis protein
VSREAKRILIVDDSEDLRSLLRVLLATEGYETATAASGAQALELLGERRFDLVISDVVMPVMDGLELLDRMHADLGYPDPPVIICSGFDVTQEEVLRRGAIAFLRKPIGAAGLLACVDKALGSQAIDGERQEHRRASDARREARAAARATLPASKFRDLVRTVSGHMQWLRRYFAVGTAVAAVLQEERLLALDGSGDPRFSTGADVTDLLPYGLDVIETGTSLLLADAAAHPSFGERAAAVRDLRYFAGVPLTSPEGVAVGVLALIAAQRRRVPAEDLLILEQLGRRASLLAAAPEAAGRQRRLPAPGVAVSGTFDVLLDAELRLLQRLGGSLELALVEIDDTDAVSSALSQVTAPERLLGCVRGPGCAAVYKRESGPNAQIAVTEALRVLRHSGHGSAAAGLVGVSGDSLPTLGAAALFRMAELALDQSIAAGGGSHRIRLTVEPIADAPAGPA